MIRKNKTIFQMIVIIVISAGFFVPHLLGAESEERSNLAQKESLSMKLLGTVVGKNSKKSIAIIEDTQSQKQSSYRITDKVLGYQIVKILRGQVILLKDGKVFSLGFPEGGELEPIVTISSSERMVNRGALIKEISDLNVLKEQIVPVPYIEAGKIAGFKIAKLEDDGLAKTAGLKEGDVVMAVNNQKLNSFKKAFEIYNNVRNEDKIDVQIKRGKEMKELTYYLN